MHRYLTAVSLLFIGHFALAPALGATLDEIEKEITAKAKKLDSYTAKIKVDMNIEQPGMSMKSESKGTMEFMRKGEKVFTRSESEGMSVMKMGDNEQKQKQKVLSITDGEYTYMLNDDMNGKQSAMKMKLDPKAISDPEGMFKYLKRDYELKVLPDAKVEGHDCYVLEGKPKKKEMAAQMSRMVYYLTKAHGLAMKVVTYGKDDKPMTTMLLSDVKINPSIDPERFKFKAPEGVEVVDMSKMQEQAAQQSSSEQTTAEDKQKEEKTEKQETPKEEKKEEPKEEKKGLGGLLNKLK